mmetsp:Transcript_24820/g.49640  ORF Transcript_24820/g.49640 Transcript_24820/m.49640 type:complete len:81 (-) Transcript_24820:284-526(-)|eukprot:10814613-Prorocentrum_lima.AAC.1
MTSSLGATIYLWSRHREVPVIIIPNTLFSCSVPFSVAVLVSKKQSSTTCSSSGRNIDLAHRSEKETSNSLVRRTEIYLNN